MRDNSSDDDGEGPEIREISNQIEKSDLEEDEFDDFDDFEEAPHIEQAEIVSQPSSKETQKVPCLLPTDFESSAQLYESVRKIIHPITASKQSTFSSPFETPVSLDPASYFNPRSSSLWNQLLLVAVHDHALNWKRSAVRKLFLVSLGVPLDLDEIMPNRNTKRLILPSTSARSQSGDDNANAESYEETLLSEWEQLANVSEMALQNMEVQELQAHIALIKTVIQRADVLLTSTLAKKKSALKDKETFEGVIESLVAYASKLRTKNKKK